MGILQWLLLLLAIGGVIAVYIVAKRREGPNPWEDMQTPDVHGQADMPPGPDTDFKAAHKAADSQSSDDVFSGLLGADDIPDLPGDMAMDAMQDDDLPDYQVRDEPAPERASSEPELNPAGLKTKSAAVEQRVIVLHVASRDGEYFQGEDIHKALQKCRLQYGLQDIYHRISEQNGVPEIVYAVANMLKPGFLNPDEAAQLQTPGLTMFMVLPGPMDGVAALKDMMETANNIAQALGGEVLDDKRVSLKRQTAQFLIDEVAEDDRKRRLTSQHA